jgi:hypothetical protein
MKNLGIFFDHLFYFTAIGNILWSFGNVVVIWYIFPRFGTLCHEKSGNPALACNDVTSQIALRAAERESRSERKKLAAV